MPRQVIMYQLPDLSHNDTPNEILLNTKENIELHIIAECDRTIIKFPFGNKFDIVDGCVIIHEKVHHRRQ